MTNRPSNELDPRFEKPSTNASELIYFGNKTTCNIVESLISTALDRVRKVRRDCARNNSEEEIFSREGSLCDITKRVSMSTTGERYFKI